MLFLRRFIVPTLIILAFATAPAAHTQAIVQPQAQTAKPAEAPKLSEFGQLIQRLSERAGYFGSDNLVSNELSYLHVLGKLQTTGVMGGAYIGVGPDQNFSYIAQIKPKLALMVDIRRDAMMQHMMFKALFMMSRNRVEYLCNLFARPLPKDGKRWETKNIRELVEYFDRTPLDAKIAERLKGEVQRKVNSFGADLSQRDLETIADIHRAFYEDCLEVRYTIRDRNTGRFFPAYRDLLLEKDLDGQYRNYLATEADFQVLKQMHDRNQIVMLTADLSGPKGVKACGDYLKEIGLKVSAFYVSNVEFYLWRQNSLDRWIENLKALPIDEKSVIIRSYFNYAYYTNPHPQTIDNSFSVQLLQTIDSLIKDQANGGYESYYDMTTRHSIDYKP
mgnify:CR=1 FL=1